MFVQQLRFYPLPLVPRDRLSTLAVLFGVIWGTDAHAQAIDAHGPVLPPTTGDPADPLLMFDAVRQEPLQWSVGGVLEFADQPLVQYVQVGSNEVLSEPVLDDLLGVNLHGTVSLHERVGVALTMPLWFANSGAQPGGPALGDLAMWIPVGLVLPEPSGEGIGVSVIPELSLPSGASARYLGNSGPVVGVSGIVDVQRGPLLLGAGAGVTTQRARTVLAGQVLGGTSAALSAHVGIRPQPSWTVGLEGRSSIALAANPLGEYQEAAGIGLPVEAFLTVRSAFGRRDEAWVRAGFGRGLTRGVGAARWRALLGAGYRSPIDDGAAPELQIDRSFAFVVSDPEGAPVSGARVTVRGEEVGRTDTDGRLTFPTGLKFAEVLVGATGFVDVAPAAPSEEESVLAITLPWLPTTVPLTVTDVTGNVLSPEFAVYDDEGNLVPISFAEGTIDLAPGTYTVVARAAAFGEQTRELTVVPNVPVAPIEFLLLEDDGGTATLAQTLVDVRGQPVSGARVLIDGKPVGATSSGGKLQVGALKTGIHTVEIRADKYHPYTQADLVLAAGTNAVKTVMRLLPGTVRVTVRTHEGIVPDATARFDGATRLPSTALGPQGERLFGPLRPGDWRLSVISPSYGIHQREITVPEAGEDILRVDVVLQPEEFGGGELAIRVVDPTGRPVDGARVSLDGKQHGVTSSASSVLRLTNLDLGPRTLGVSSPDFREIEEIPVFLVEGVQEQLVTMDWREGATEVAVRTSEGPVPDAVLRFVGPTGHPAAPLGPLGVGRFTLAPGAWSVVASSASLGLAQRRFTVDEDSRRLHRVDVLIAPPEGGTADLEVVAVDASGNPAADAQVYLDGQEMGVTLDGRLALPGLTGGGRTLELRAPLYLPYEALVPLTDQAVTHTATMAYAPGATEIRVVGDAGPVTDAVVRMVGAKTIAPARVGEDGTLRFALAPGVWQALVISPSSGIAQKSFEIPDASELTEVDVLMEEVEAGMAEMLVRVVDPDGTAVVNAELWVEEQLRAVTGEGGGALMTGLLPGELQYTVRHPHFEQESLTGTVVAGSQERVVTLAYRPGSIRVVTRDESGSPVDARVTFEGDVYVAPQQTGTTGDALFALRPGPWTVFSSTETLGPARASLEVRAEDDVQVVELTLLPARVTVSEAAVEFEDEIPFAFDSDALTDAARPVLEAIADALRVNQRVVRIEVQGHTDSVGDVAYNQSLSQRRAESVRTLLVELGVAPEKVVAQGYGPQRPVATNETEEGRGRNRRVAFTVQLAE